MTIFASLSASSMFRRISCHHELMHKYIMIPTQAQDGDTWHYPPECQHWSMNNKGGIINYKRFSKIQEERASLRSTICSCCMIIIISVLRSGLQKSAHSDSWSSLASQPLLRKIGLSLCSDSGYYP